MKIVVFTNNKRKVKFPIRSGLECQFINFNSTDLNDLMLIAKYRIVNFPTSLIIDSNEKILLKVKGSIPGSYVDNLMAGS